MTQRGLIATGTIATGIIAAGIITYMLAGGSHHPHVNTSIDASTSTTPPNDIKRGYARTGTICYRQSATTSKCFAANELAYAVDATDVGWPIEPAQVNRILYNVSSTCDGTPYTCTTATMDATTADPAGGTTASTITMGGGNASLTATGYTVSTAVDLRLWAKCSSGTLDASNVGGEGHWTVNCTTVAGAWALLTSSHAAVTEVQAWKSTGAGALNLTLSAADVAVWQPTATEVTAYPRSTRLLSTIPTAAAAATVGATAWTVDNSSGAYWAATGVTKVETGTIHNGTCWSYTAPTITLSGASTCHGIRYALSLTWTY
jgi:hypothetical protein